jgi:hypothetical protein
MLRAQRAAGKSPSLAKAHSQSVGLVDDRQAPVDLQAHARRPPTVTTTSSPRTSTG